MTARRAAGAAGLAVLGAVAVFVWTPDRRPPAPSPEAAPGPASVLSEELASAPGPADPTADEPRPAARLAEAGVAPTRVAGVVFDPYGQPTRARVEVVAEGTPAAEPLVAQADRATGRYAVEIDGRPSAILVRAEGPGGTRGERRVECAGANEGGVVHADVYLVATSGTLRWGRIVDADLGTPLGADTLRRLLRAPDANAVFSQDAPAGGIWAVGSAQSALEAIPAAIDVERAEFVVGLPSGWTGEFVLLSHGSVLASAPWAEGTARSSETPVLRVPPTSIRPCAVVVRVSAEGAALDDVRMELSRRTPRFDSVAVFTVSRARAPKTPDPLGPIVERFEGLPPGDYVLRVAAAGHAEELRSILVEPTREADVTITLRPAVTVDVCIEEKSSPPRQVAAGDLRVYDDEGRRRSATITEVDDAGGACFRFLIGGLAPGRIHLVCGGDRLSLDLPLAAGATVRWSLARREVVRFTVGPYVGVLPGTPVTCAITPRFPGTAIPAATPMTYSGRVSEAGTISGTLLLPAGSYDVDARIGGRTRTVPCEVVAGAPSQVSVVVP